MTRDIKQAGQHMNDIYEDARAYEKAKICGLSTVECVNMTSRRIVISTVEHAGTISHICVNDKGHESMCRCPCGYMWSKNVK